MKIEKKYQVKVLLEIALLLKEKRLETIFIGILKELEVTDLKFEKKMNRYNFNFNYKRIVSVNYKDISNNFYIFVYFKGYINN